MKAQGAALAFKVQARHLLAPTPPGPKPRKKIKRGGGDSRRMISVAIVGDYLELCRNPAHDVLRWLQETDDTAGVGALTRPTTTKGDSHADHEIRRTTPVMEDTRRLRRDPLHSMHHGLDTHRHSGRSADGLPARSFSSAGRYDELRSVRAEQGQDLTTATPAAETISSDLGSELGAVASEFATRIAAIRASAKRADVATLVRAVVAEMLLAKRAVVARSHAARRNAKHNQNTQRVTLVRPSR